MPSLDSPTSTHNYGGIGEIRIHGLCSNINNLCGVTITSIRNTSALFRIKDLRVFPTFSA